tara:strand:- start:576 stop:809 length:234 start_codon:yes stop_codon:yes gene_type:complete
MIELLVTIAIISILTGLLLSAVSSAKKKAQKASCRIVIRSYALKFNRIGQLLIEIPQEANCYQCHYPKWNEIDLQEP